jgi:hypothetical protein
MPSGVDQSWIGEEARNLRGASDLCSGSGEALGLHRAGAPSHTLRSVERRERDAGLLGDPFGGLLRRSGVDWDGTRGPLSEESFGTLEGVDRAVLALHTLVSRFGSLAGGLRSKRRAQAGRRSLGIGGLHRPAPERARSSGHAGELRFGSRDEARKETPLQASPFGEEGIEKSAGGVGGT